MGDSSNHERGAQMELLRFLDTVGPESLVSTPDWVYELLKNEPRRHLVLYLSEQETPTPVSRVAMEIASRCNEVPVTDVTSAEQEQYQFRLEQDYLPRLADYGVIEWSYGEDLVNPIPSILASDEEHTTDETG